MTCALSLRTFDRALPSEPPADRRYHATDDHRGRAHESRRYASDVDARYDGGGMLFVMTHHGINLAHKLSQFNEPWSPRTVTTFNGHDVMVVKVKGEFTWHSHDNTDDFFLVLSGRVVIRLRDGDVELGPGELFVVPAGVEHQPVAMEEATLLLIEPTGTPNTGDPSTSARRVEI
jgi:mannose-6-phosphate isomerase-like protein (cupin superfamily)